MSEPTKPRFTVDLEEIDRQLRRSAAPSPAASRPVVPLAVQESQIAQPTSPGLQNDPLAELARIVGQEDPFQSILSQPVAPQQRTFPPQADPYVPAQGYSDYEPTPQPARSPDVDALAELLRSEPRSAPAAYEGPALENPNYPSYARQSRSYEQSEHEADQFHPLPPDQISYPPQPEHTYTPNTPQQGAYDNYNPSYDDPKLGYSPGYTRFDEDYGAPQPKSGKKLFLYGGVAALCLIGIATAYGFMRNGGIGGSSEVPLVTASSEPTKVPPEAPGGKEFPDQNKQIYERNSTEGKTQIVNREEQPVDVQQATRGSGGSTTRSEYGEPRKVRTVAVRPNGSVIGGEPAQSAPRNMPETAAVASHPAASDTSPIAHAVQSTTAAATEAQPSATTTPADSVDQSIAVPPPPRRPATLAAATTSDTAAAATSAPQRTAAATPATAAPPAAASGGFVVQFGVSGSEADGVARFRRLQNQHPNLMADVSGSVRPAEVGGKTIYRIRSTPMSKEESDALCSKLKAAGTECYVAKN